MGTHVGHREGMTRVRRRWQLASASAPRRSHRPTPDVPRRAALRSTPPRQDSRSLPPYLDGRVDDARHLGEQILVALGLFGVRRH